MANLSCMLDCLHQQRCDESKEVSWTRVSKPQGNADTISWLTELLLRTTCISTPMPAVRHQCRNAACCLAGLGQLQRPSFRPSLVAATSSSDPSTCFAQVSCLPACLLALLPVCTLLPEAAPLHLLVPIRRPHLGSRVQVRPLAPANSFLLSWPCHPQPCGRARSQKPQQ